MGKVGGKPSSIGAGGARLLATSKRVADRPTGITGACIKGEGGCGQATLDAALQRFAAAYSQFAADVSTELKALGTLADSTAADLALAGGAN